MGKPNPDCQGKEKQGDPDPIGPINEELELREIKERLQSIEDGQKEILSRLDQMTGEM